ncbi:MAG: suppressor of fused domain protein [Anaerolineae bacterium]|nr:suppressor of fused domain protein [Anaerolineae bacterium]
MTSFGECYLNHYEQYFGDFKERTMFRQNDQNPIIQILSYERVFQGCAGFCTLGLTHYQAEVNGLAEVFLPVDDGWKQTPYILTNTLFYMVQRRMPIGQGTSIGGIENIDPEFCKKYQKSALYFTWPFELPEGFTEVNCGTSTGYVFLAIYISKKEYDFFRKYGAKQFESLLENEGVDVLHLSRQSAL